MEEARMDLPTAIKQVLGGRTGNEFQNTVQEILRNRVKGFQAVEPYGRDGDGGNDGYSRSLGLYAQIYAPQSQKASTRAAARKTARDFAKLLRKWQHISPIKDFLFVMNAPASNIHVEEALSRIQERHGVNARFVGTSELTEEALQMNRSRLEALMGFKVADVGEQENVSSDLNLIAEADPKFLDALHLLAALDYPVVPELCQGLLPRAVEWKKFWKWAKARGWINEHGTSYELDRRIIETCHKNETAQRRACEIWIPALHSHGSIDCLYLSLRPLVMLSQLTDAVRVITDGGVRLADSGWGGAMLKMWEIFNQPKLLRKLSTSDRGSFLLARANLLAVTGKSEEAFVAFTTAFRQIKTWPRSISRSLMLLNFGVAAHKSGYAEQASELYVEAAKLARRQRDNWVLGRATSNLAQSFIASDLPKALSLLQESEAAKRRANDRSGLITVAMIHGLIAIEGKYVAEANAHFKRARKLLGREHDIDILIDLSFNMAKSYGDLGQWKNAVNEYLVSLKEAEKQKEDFKALRARNGLADAFFHLSDWPRCAVELNILARLPHATPHVDFRLAGLHGMFLLTVLKHLKGQVEARFEQALQYAKWTKREDWISRLFIDREFGSPHQSMLIDKCERLLSSAKQEFKSDRLDSAMAIARTVWNQAIRAGEKLSDIEDRAAKLLDSIAIQSRDAGKTIDLLKWRYSTLAQVGNPLRAAKCLENAAKIARVASLWREYVAAVDQKAVVLAELDRPDLAVPLHREALRIAKREALPHEERISASNLAECLRRVGRHREALKMSTTALALHNPNSEPESFISSLHNHFLVLKALGRPNAAQQILRKCETLARKHSIFREEVKASIARGNTAWDDGNLRAAEKLYRRALETAMHHGIESEASDCRYNLAIMLRQRGRSTEALRLLEVASDTTFDPLHSLHRLTLTALILEDVGRLEDAHASWINAAQIGETIEDRDQRAYCETRAYLLKVKPGDAPAQRASVANRARDLTTAILMASTVRNKIQRAYDEAQVFAKEEKLEFYRIRAHQVVADRLSLCRNEKSLKSATEASMASVVTSFGNELSLQFAMFGHARWLMSLGLPVKKIRLLRSVAENWVTENIKTKLRRDILKFLLSGFDMVEREISANHRAK